jgi:hypothetical protein
MDVYTFATFHLPQVYTPSLCTVTVEKEAVNCHTGKSEKYCPV